MIITMNLQDSTSLQDFVRSQTKGKPYVFVIMNYKTRHLVYQHIKAIVEQHQPFLCLRADETIHLSQDLLAKIHYLIEQADMVIAEISEFSANVFYEVGYAMGVKKPIVFLLDKSKRAKVPIDLRSRELIYYSDSKDDLEHLESRLRQNLVALSRSEIPLLRDMLEAPRWTPAFIVASPKYPSKKSARIRGQVLDEQTFGDNLGIRGLISAFGLIHGEAPGVELISGRYCPANLDQRDINLYLIGSEKVNPLTRRLMPQIQLNSRITWEIKCAHGYIPSGDYPMALYRYAEGGSRQMKGQRKQLAAGLPSSGVEAQGYIHIEDYGLILRSPHPKHPGRMVLIMAGAHSLGTGAACLAATRSHLIRQIKKALVDQGMNLADKECAFYALVKGIASQSHWLLEPEDDKSVQIVEVGRLGDVPNVR